MKEQDELQYSDYYQSDQSQEEGSEVSDCDSGLDISRTEYLKEMIT